MADDIGTELAGWLRSRAGLVVLLDVDDKKAPRIHPGELPQSAGVNPNAIVYHLISDFTEGHVGGVSSVCQAVIQFDCYGASPITSNRIRLKLKAELDAKSRGQIGNLFACAIVHAGDRDETEKPLDGSDKSRFIRQTDYRISYQRPT